MRWKSTGSDGHQIQSQTHTSLPQIMQKLQGRIGDEHVGNRKCDLRCSGSSQSPWRHTRWRCSPSPMQFRTKSCSRPPGQGMLWPRRLKKRATKARAKNGSRVDRAQSLRRACSDAVNQYLYIYIYIYIYIEIHSLIAIKIEIYKMIVFFCIALRTYPCRSTLTDLSASQSMRFGRPCISNTSAIYGQLRSAWWQLS